MSHAGYRTIKLLAGENFRERKIVFTTPPDATSISIHYLQASVKRKCHATDLSELLLHRIKVGLSGLFLPILYILRTNCGFACRFIPELCGKLLRVPADFSASLARFFAKNSAYHRKKAAECGKNRVSSAVWAGI